MRLIDADALESAIDAINSTDYGSMFDYNAHREVDKALRDVLRIVCDAPTVDADPVRHGGTTWDVFDDLASSYYGKQMYFTQPDGTIYSRLSCGYMTFEEALAEFREAIGMDGGKKDG